MTLYRYRDVFFFSLGRDSDLIRIENVDCSKMVCEADVALVKRLSRRRGRYQLSLEVKDTRGERTVVTTEIEPTPSQGPFME